MPEAKTSAVFPNHCEFDVMTSNALLCAERREQTMIQNLVHEEFCREITDVYNLARGKILGSGCFGNVQVAEHRISGEKYALKTVELDRLKDKRSFEAIMKEVSVMKNLDHPNIVRLQEVYQTPRYLFLIMDLCTGGNLMQSYKFYSEDEAVDVIRSVVNAIRYCHDRNIAHRDIKLENIVREHIGPDAEVKLVDFGLSCHFMESELEFDVVGTWIYMAPEVIGGSHFPTACDMWSIGVITYLLLCGYPPFMGRNRDELVHEIRHGTYKFHPKSWQHITPLAKNFIKRLLVRNARERMTAAEAQHHPWLNINYKDKENRRLPEDVVKNIVKFRNENLVKKLALKAVARALEPEHIKELERQFFQADLSETGEITMMDLKCILDQSIPHWYKFFGNPSNILNNENAIEEIFNGVAMDGSTSLCFNDFMAASMNRRMLDTKSLQIAFDRLDYDHSGTISVDDLELMIGANIDCTTLKAAIMEWDSNGDGVIDFKEFCAAMRKNNDVSLLDLATMRNRKLTNCIMDKKVAQSFLIGSNLDLSALSESNVKIHGGSNVYKNDSDSSLHVIGDGYNSEGCGGYCRKDDCSGLEDIRQAFLVRSVSNLSERRK